MRVFLSWSGELSQSVARIFAEWLPFVLPPAKPYLSSRDIDKGTHWSTMLQDQLRSTAFGVVFITRSNVRSPWINFEAGALFNTIKGARVVPFLIDLPSKILDGPFSQFQHARPEKKDVLALVKSINNSLNEADRLAQNILEHSFNKWWEEFDKKLKVQMSLSIDQEVKDPADVLPLDELYTCCGLDRATTKDSVYQDFRINRDGYNPNPVYYMWADNYRASTIDAKIVPERYALLFRDATDAKTERETIRKIEMQFDSKKKECPILIVRTTSDSETWTVAGYSDNGEFRTVVIDDPSHELRKELEKEPRSENRLGELSKLALGCAHSENVLQIFFDHGQNSWGCNIAIRPRDDIGIMPGNRYLCFDSRLAEHSRSEGYMHQVAMSIRLVDRRMTHWDFALPRNDYRPIKHHQFLVGQYTWQSFSVDLASEDWQLFRMDGNQLYAKDKPEFSVLAAVVLAFGSSNPEFRPGPGKGIIEVKDIRFQDDPIEKC